VQGAELAMIIATEAIKIARMLQIPFRTDQRLNAPSLLSLRRRVQPNSIRTR
jgi:hypothetical protein